MNLTVQTIVVMGKVVHNTNNSSRQATFQIQETVLVKVKLEVLIISVLHMLQI